MPLLPLPGRLLLDLALLLVGVLVGCVNRSVRLHPLEMKELVRTRVLEHALLCIHRGGE